ncbi:alpha/beta hydrolase [Pseudoalteromonas sp. ACER1]|uniref:alpha/beta hydrolase n=1 Tax=unclassified Pseudoalteromonas TaxID=194690 RepID=UPI001F1FF87F|nr:alpha/beta hydrolase [Pseudoalteromonas sp. ACER1]MCF2846380.1 alpha/beta hydrolase [Pseudoalteromonas sp. PAST1]MCO7209745.1 alpha/beta hydrolase [Pseudoalteromonas sp. ACER1]
MNIQTVSIQNHDMAWEISALVLTPANFDESKTYPTMISVHPFGSCKEQTSSSVYGKALAEAGYVVIAFDASYQGQSGGTPRFIENPSQRVEDISHVIDYAVTLPYVDNERIGSIGVCGGGAYVFNSALTEKRVKAVVGITPVNLGRLFREAFTEFNPLGALEAMAAQRTAEALGGDLQVNELLPPSIEFARDNGLTERDVFEATDYYKTSRGQSEGGATRMLFSHAQKTLTWDAFAFAETLMTQPMMAVIGQKVGAFGAYRDGKEIYGKSFASKDRQLVELEEWSHYDLYDNPEPVALAMQQILPFLANHL